MNSEAAQFDRAFLTKWVLFTTGACILSLPVVIVLPQLGAGLVTAACVGAIVAYAQWLVLSRRIALSRWWVLAGAVSLGLTFPIGFSLSRAGFLPQFLAETAIGPTVVGVVVGLLSGILQMPLLKPHFTNAIWWVPASSVGWGLCLLVGSGNVLLDSVNASVAGSSNLVVALVTGLAAFVYGLLFPIPFGLVTGAAIMWMAKRSAGEQPEAAKQTKRGNLGIVG